MGLYLSNRESSMVTAARNSITVILSINMDSIVDNTIKVIKSGITLYLTSFAIYMHNHLKKPTLAIPSTITIIPKMKIMVSQLIPALLPPSFPV